MKKILAHIIFLFVSYTLTAQNNFKWAEEGAVWNSTYNFWMGSLSGYSEFKYLSDTIIGNKHCQKITGTSEEGGISGLSGEFFLFPKVYDTLFLYRSNDSVFSYRFNRWQLAFKTNAIEGEIWNLGSPDGIKNAFVKVDSVFYQNYNGVPLRNIKISPCDSLGSELSVLTPDTVENYIPSLAIGFPLDSNYNIINEKLGPLTSLLSLNRFISTTILNCGIPGKILCYQSNDFGFYQTGSSDCFNDLFVNIKEFEENAQILVYPNPAQNNLNIEIKNQTMLQNIEVINAIRQVMLISYNQNNGNISIDTKELCNGFYLLKLNYKNGESQLGKFQILK